MSLDTLVRKSTEAFVYGSARSDFDELNNAIISTASTRTVIMRKDWIHGLRMLNDEQSRIISEKTEFIGGGEVSIKGVGKMILLLKATTGESKVISFTAWYAETSPINVVSHALSLCDHVALSISPEESKLLFKSELDNEMVGAPLIRILDMRCIIPDDMIVKSENPTPSQSQSQSKSQPYVAKKVYADGACKKNNQSYGSRSAGCGIFFGFGDDRNFSVKVGITNPTNQIAELIAIREALKSIIDTDLKMSIVKYSLHTDSEYAIKCLTEYYKKWERNGWTNAKGQEVKNMSYIKQSLEYLRTINKCYNQRGWGDLTFVHVKGHSGDEGNDMADKLANYGCLKDSI